MSKVQFTPALNKQVKELRESGKSYQEIADATGLKLFQVYYSLKGRKRARKLRKKANSVDKAASVQSRPKKASNEAALMDLLAELVASRIEAQVTKAIIERLK